MNSKKKHWKIQLISFMNSCHCLKSFIFSNFISNQFLQNWHEIFISTSLIKVTQSVKIVLNKCEKSILCFLKLCFWSNRFLQNWHENRLFIYFFVERVFSKIDMNLFSVFRALLWPNWLLQNLQETCIFNPFYIANKS